MAVAGSGGWIPSTAVTITNDRITPVGITQNKPRHLIYSLHADDDYAGDLQAGYLALRAEIRIIIDARHPNLEAMQTIHARNQDLTIPIALLRAGVPMKDIRPFLP